MPNRMLRDWTDSLRFDGLSTEAERMFTRLIMKADDYGRFHAEPRLIKASCFPLIEDLRSNEISEWTDELTERGLVTCYEVDGRGFLAIVNYGQRLKQSRAKFPQKRGESDDWLPIHDSFHQVPGTSRNFPSEEKGIRREVETEYEADCGNSSTPPPVAGEGNPSTTLPKGWRNWPATRQQTTKAGFLTPAMIRIGGWFGRRETTQWTVAEAGRLMDLDPDEDELRNIEPFYTAVISKDDYRRQNVLTLLNNWSGEQDKARIWRAENL